MKNTLQRIDSWRGWDLTPRYRKIENAFKLIKPDSPEDIPIIINTPCYFGYGNYPRPKEYFSDPETMVRFQEEAFEKHLAGVPDDTVPYFMPWFGTGVLASAFGSKIRDAEGTGDDPAVEGIICMSPEDIDNLCMPEPGKSGLMSRVVECIDYAVNNSDLPVGLTDMNSPLCTAAQLCGYENLFVWMYEYPEKIGKLIGMISRALTEWVVVQKEHNGEPLDASNGLQGVWSPEGAGIWLSDDDLVSINAELYEKFIIEPYSEIFTKFGGGSLHYCGVGTHQTENLLKIRNIRAVNNSPLGKFDEFKKLYRQVTGKLTIQIQDATPANPEFYYGKLFSGIDDFTGIMMAAFVEDELDLDNDGCIVNVKREPIAHAARVTRALREIFRENMKQ